MDPATSFDEDAETRTANRLREGSLMRAFLAKHVARK